MVRRTPSHCEELQNSWLSRLSPHGLICVAHSRKTQLCHSQGKQSHTRGVGHAPHLIIKQPKALPLENTQLSPVQTAVLRCTPNCLGHATQEKRTAAVPGTCLCSHPGRHTDRAGASCTAFVISKTSESTPGGARGTRCSLTGSEFSTLLSQ